MPGEAETEFLILPRICKTAARRGKFLRSGRELSILATIVLHQNILEPVGMGVRRRKHVSNPKKASR